MALSWAGRLKAVSQLAEAFDMTTPHGTPGGYTNHGCRCSRCREAWRVYHWLHMHRDPTRLREHADRERDKRFSRGEETEYIEIVLEDLRCWCGAGPFRNERGLAIHQGRVH